MELNVEKVLHMNGGQGERSYARNSSYQGNILCFLQPFLQECISNMKIIPCERFCIADLGCSSGPNTLFIAETICKAIQGKYMASMALPIPQLQVFFSDLPSNDFNLLLRSLPLPPNQENDDDNNNDDDDDDDDDDKDRIPRCNYFAAAVAGSFHRRLFPTNSLHFVHSSFSLHWLSQVPAKIEDRTSGSWNKGRVFISKDSPVEVGEAYLIQFKKDFNSFLRARSEEVVGGGCMFLFLSGRPDSCEDPRDQGPIAISWEILQDSFNDMVLQGVIEEEKRDSFNLPFFSPSAKELRLELEKEGSFTVKRIEYLSEWGYSAQFDMEKRNNETFGKMVAIQTRAVLEELISSHFGEDVVGLLFENFARRVADRASEVLNVSQYEGGKFFIVLERQ